MIFHTSLYITAIQTIAFHLPHSCILGTDHCGNTLIEALKSCRENKYVFLRRDYAERLVASFAHQIQYEYYDGNWSVSTKVIALDRLSAPTEKKTPTTPQSCKRHDVFH